MSQPSLENFEEDFRRLFGREMTPDERKLYLIIKALPQGPRVAGDTTRDFQRSEKRLVKGAAEE